MIHVSVKGVWNAFGQHMKALDWKKSFRTTMAAMDVMAAMVAIVGENNGARWKKMKRFQKIAYTNSLYKRGLKKKITIKNSWYKC